MTLGCEIQIVGMYRLTAQIFPLGDQAALFVYFILFFSVVVAAA